MSEIKSYNLEKELYEKTIDLIATKLYRKWIRNHILRNIDLETIDACTQDMETLLTKHQGEDEYRQKLLTARGALVEKINQLVDKNAPSPDFSPKNEMDRSIWISDIIKRFHEIIISH